MIKFILGGSGSGKTHRIREMIRLDAEEKIQSILIVPEQETVAAERRMLDILPPSAQLTFEVTNFTRLANRVFRVYGGLTYKYISAGAKSLAMWNTLRTLSPLLSVYGTQTDDPAFSSLMLSAAEEFKAYCVTPASLEKASAMAESGSRTKGKLSDLAFIYAAYNNSISGYGDGSDDIGKLALTLEKHNFFAGFHVYVDSFTSFTSAELAVLSHIASQADELTVTLCISDDGGLQFETLEETMRKLERIAEKNGTETEKEVLTENRRTNDPELCRLARDIWRFDAETDEVPMRSGAIELIKCTNIYEEAEAAATKVGELVRKGIRYREIVILARDVSAYEGIIDDALEKAEIPFFMSRGRDVTTMPLSKLLLCALRIINGGWNGEDVITYLKTGLCSLSERETDLLEEYIWRWNINGKAFVGDDWTMNPYSYSGELNEHSADILRTVNEARKKFTSALVSFEAELDSAEDNTGLCRAVFNYMESLSVKETLYERAKKAEESGAREEASEMLQLYNTVLELLSIIAEFDSGDGKFDLREFENAFRTVLTQASIGSIPTSCDEVTVGSASMLRADEPRVVIMIGMNEGVFPENVSENGVFSDEEKHFLNECGVSLSGDTAEKSSEELFYVYRAVSAPSEKLIMTYSASELQGGKERLPSVAFSRALLLTGAEITDYASLPFEKKIPCEHSAFEYSALLGEKPEGRALRRYFSGKEEYVLPLEHLTMPIYERECHVNDDLTDKVFGNHMSFSPSMLESYVRCHFNYYCEKILKLRPYEKNILRLNDTGSLIHDLLEKFIRRVTGENGFDASLAEEECEDILAELVKIYAEENFPEKDVRKAKTEYILKKLHGLSVVMAKSITKELSSGKFVPSFFELKINEYGGENSAVGPTFVLDGGEEFSLHGFADRVDLMRDGDDVFVKVIDYKTGSKTFSQSKLKDGLDTQMLLYLFALCGNKDNRVLLGCSENGRVIPAGAVYMSSKNTEITEPNGTENKEILLMAENGITRSGLFLDDERVKDELKIKSKDSLKSEEEFYTIKSELDETLKLILSELRHGNACIFPKEVDGRYHCEYCRMRAVCRSAHVISDETMEED